jgi:molybdopterin/thiamine biosynthesis adenylyltransferase
MLDAVRTVLVIGAGGLGCPILRVLGEYPHLRFRVVDDDVVDISNLHRQLLYRERDVGHLKVEVLAGLPLLQHRIDARPVRFLPENATELMQGIDVIVEGTDNFATKFLVCDRATYARVPVVHAACVRWHGTVFAANANARPCYRCLFEDVPEGDAPNCAEAGILGPVAGAVGALAANAALQLLTQSAPDNASGSLWTFDGRSITTRKLQIAARAECTNCGTGGRA